MVSSKILILNKKADNLFRKIIHIISAFLIFFFPYFFSSLEIIIISIIAAVFFFLARHFNFLKIINKTKRVSWGEVFYPLGVGLLALFFLPGELRAFQFAVLVLGLSDGLANILGSLFGTYRRKIMGGHKSLEGSLVFFFSTFLLFIFLSDLETINLFHLFLSSLLLTALESFLVLGLDNLVLPLLSAYLFSLVVF